MRTRRQSTPIRDGRAATHATAARQVPRRWLLLVRLAWLSCALLTVALFVAGLPLFYHERLHQVCTGPAALCTRQGLLTTSGRQQLAALGVSLRFDAVFTISVMLIFQGVWWLAGLLIFWRRSTDWMALLVALSLVTFVTSYPLDALAQSYPVWRMLVQSILFGNAVAVTYFFYLFPDGRFVPRWTRWLALVWSVLAFPVEFFPDSPFNYTRWPAVLAVAVGGLQLGSYVVAQVYRYRRVSNARQRQQTKWVVFGATAGLIIVLTTAASTLLGPSEQGISVVYYIPLIAFRIGFTLIPLSIGVAMLRSQLFDIDVLIRRTLIYSALTAILALVYFGSVVVLQQLLRGLTGQTSSAAIVASTLAMAALFQPLRRRIQTTIDRRFYRRKYDAATTLAAFSARCRDEVDLNVLTGDLLVVVEETLQPMHVSLWLRQEAPRVREQQGEAHGMRA